MRGMPNVPANLSYRSRGYAIALVSAAILSTTAIFIRYLTQTYHLPALVLATWRDGFVALTLLPVLALIRPGLLHLDRKHLGYLLVYGLVLSFFNSFWTISVALNGAAVATVLVYCSAGFTALLSWWLLKEPLGWAKLLAVLVSLSGCVLVSGALDASAWQSQLNTLLPGIVTGVLSGLMYAIYSLMGRTAAQRGLSPWTTLLYTFAFACGFLLFFNLLPLGQLSGGILASAVANKPADFLWLGSAWPGWIALFLLAAGPTLAGFGLYNVSLSYLPSSVANLLVTTEPVFTLVIAYFLLGERLVAVQIAGSLMILAGVVLLKVFENRIAENALEAGPGDPAGIKPETVKPEV